MLLWLRLPDSGGFYGWKEPTMKTLIIIKLDNYIFLLCVVHWKQCFVRWKVKKAFCLNYNLVVKNGESKEVLVNKNIDIDWCLYSSSDHFFDVCTMRWDFMMNSTVTRSSSLVSCSIDYSFIAGSVSSTSCAMLTVDKHGQ